MNSWSFVVLVALASATAYAQDRIRVCFVTNWAQYRPAPATFFPNQTDPSLCSHVMFAFAIIDTNNRIIPQQWNDDTPGGLYDQTIALKQREPNLKVSISVGGYNFGMSQVTLMLATPETRATFINSVITFCRARDFDGVDLDFQFPGYSSPPDDKFKFTSLLQEFRAAIANESASTGDAPLLLTASVGAQKATIDAGYEVPLVSTYLDFINLMSYDYNGAWDTISGMNSPLYERSDEVGTGREFRNVDWSANYWVELGAAREKLVIGIALYGRTFTLTNLAETGVGAPVNGAGIAGIYTREAGFLAYYEICQMLIQTSTEKVFHDEHKNPYAYRGDQWVGYDDEESLKYKVDYIVNNGFAGWMAWNTDLDDFSGNLGCNAGPYPLLTAANRFLAEASPTPPTGSTAGPTAGPTDAPTDAPTDVPTDAPTDASISEEPTAAKRPARKRRLAKTTK